MPVVRKSKRDVPDDQNALLERLKDEFSGGASRDPRPRILIEGEDVQGPIHLFVLWEDWDELSLQDRSRLILEAYEKTTDNKANVPRVTVALGLKEAEARGYGLHPQDFEEQAKSNAKR